MTSESVPVLSAEDKAGAGRATSYWHHVSCACGWSRSVQLNAKPTTIRKGFREIGEHFADHRIAASEAHRG